MALPAWARALRAHSASKVPHGIGGSRNVFLQPYLNLDKFAMYLTQFAGNNQGRMFPVTLVLTPPYTDQRAPHPIRCFE